MSAAKIISLTAGIIHSLFALFFLFQNYSLLVDFLTPRPHPGFDDAMVIEPDPIILILPLIALLSFAIISFIFWFFLKNKEKQNVRVRYGLIVSIFLLGAPFLIFFLVGVYADFMMSKIINETL